MMGSVTPRRYRALLTGTEEERREQEKRELDDYVKNRNDGPDLRVNKEMVKFTSLSSSDNLRQHYEARKMELGDCAADWIKSLVEKLGAFTSAPGLAGLGALAIAVFIDIISFSPPEESTKEALRCVFAEEKASEVWDQIDECLKRCVMHIQDKDRLRSDIERIECQLSVALTKLKNSMMRDGHMSSQALKAWVNGAAFHIQMLIHLLRLGGIQTCDPVKRILSTYQSDLDTLFIKHREVKREKFDSGCVIALYQHYRLAMHEILMSDNKGRWLSNEKYFEAYYAHRYSRQKGEIHQHFSDVRENLQSLVDQRGSFNV